MSWLGMLYDTYEACSALPGSAGEGLLPVSHTLQNAHINIVIDGQGNFKRASVLEKTQVFLPATEKSAGRSSGEAPHPLADKIHYVAKDYPAYGGRKKNYFSGYEAQLAAWCASGQRHEKAVAVHRYISKGRVVKDLVDHCVLYLDPDMALCRAWEGDGDDTPAIFKVLPRTKGQIKPGDALVCWSVETGSDPSSDTWTDKSLQQSWIDYNDLSGGSPDFCFITGEQVPAAENHPAKLRHTGDKAKLVSANDSSGFTFRGRFTDAKGKQAACVGYEVTQKAHNALRWLISRQGFRNGDQVFVCWAVSGRPLPDPLKSSWDLLNAEPAAQEAARSVSAGEVDHAVDLGAYFAGQLKKYMAGYRADLSPSEQILIMGLDSATPGRMGIIYYRRLTAGEFLDRLESWHSQFAWPQRRTTEILDPGGRKKPSKKTIWPVSSPVPGAIAEAAYGRILKSSDTLKKSVVERILPCIADGRPLPRDLVVSAVRAVCNRNGYEKWEWEKRLGVACALYKGFYLRHPQKDKRRAYDMALEKDRTTRDYLYGRLLAVAERIEETALRAVGEDRPVTAARLMQRFADRPFSTWRNIELALQPYMQRLKNTRPGFLVNCKKDLDKVLSAFSPEDFTSDKALSGEFLLGYHCQKQHWQTTFENKNTK